MKTRKTQAPHPERLTARRWILLSIAVFVLIFGAGGSWAYLARIAGAVIAPGAVSPQSGIKAIQHPEGGIVKKIFVREGAHVRAREIVMILDDKEIQANLAITRTRLFSALAEISRLEAERDGGEKIFFPPELLASAEPIAHHAMKTQEALFRSRRNTVESQKKMLQQKIAALRRSMKGMQVELQATDAQLALIAEEVKTVSTLLEEGNALKPRLLALKRTAADLMGQKGRLNGEIAKARETIAEIRLQILGLKRDFLSRILDRLSQIQKEAGILRQQYGDLRRRLEMTRIRSPVDGKILDMTIRTIGGVVAPRQTIMHVVPENEDLIIEARISPRDIEQVSPGQRARIVFSSFTGKGRSPTLKGVVKVISPAPIIEQKTSAPYYHAEILVDRQEMARLGDLGHVVPGIPAEVYITLPERSPLQMMLRPFYDGARRAFRND